MGAGGTAVEAAILAAFDGEQMMADLEALGEIGVADSLVLDTIAPFLDHERPLIRSAAARALLQLTGEPSWAEPLLALLDPPPAGALGVALRRGGQERPPLGFSRPFRRLSSAKAEGDWTEVSVIGLSASTQPE